jgi:NitT/TauT family transport system ATP-binding protein
MTVALVDTSRVAVPDPLITLRDVSKTYRSGAAHRVAVEGVSLDLGRGEFVSFVGPSGCGKTTTLMMMAGLVRTSSGSISMLGEPITAPPEDAAVVFQDYSRSLFPWMRVGKNVALALNHSGLGKVEVNQRVEEVLTRVGLAGSARLYPWQLSGGMQQRVAIARALAVRPKLLMMDEPFAAVDAQTRIDLEDLLLELWSGTGMTVVFVTHDIDESVYLADRVVVMAAHPGRILKEVVVDLPRPRNQIETKELHEYAELRATVLELVRDRGSSR